MIKIFFYQNAVRADIFLWLFGSFVRPRAVPAQIELIIWGAVLGRQRRPKMRSNYLNYRVHSGKSQISLGLAAACGDQIIRNFIIKNQLAVLPELAFRVKENFYHF